MLIFGELKKSIKKVGCGRGPGNECGVKVRRMRDENEAMGRKDGCGVLMVGRREIASE
jgi:hypothetical protein